MEDLKGEKLIFISMGTVLMNNLSYMKNVLKRLKG